ncbi:MAG: S-layer protein [Candidatus Aenigmatarchaeota archaeon]
MQIVNEEKGKMLSIGAKEKQLFSGIALKILKTLADHESYPKEIANQLRLDEQKIYYHIRQLEKKGYISLVRKEERGGALAKFYALTSPAFFVRFGEFQETKRFSAATNFLPFISNGRLEAKIIVGSPDPHGPEKARSRDVTFAVDLALFLGTFLNKVEVLSVLEDKDVHSHDLSSNLIIVGGPVTNKVTKMVNDKLPVRFDAKKNIMSRKKVYKEDECGFIAKTDNPFSKGKKIIVIAGKRYSGTKAAVIAFINNFDLIEKKNYLIVEGLDNDGDGEIDDARVLE